MVYKHTFDRSNSKDCLELNVCITICFSLDTNDLNHEPITVTNAKRHPGVKENCILQSQTKVNGCRYGRKHWGQTVSIIQNRKKVINIIQSRDWKALTLFKIERKTLTLFREEGKSMPLFIVEGKSVILFKAERERY